MDGRPAHYKTVIVIRGQSKKEVPNEENEKFNLNLLLKRKEKVLRELIETWDPELNNGKTAYLIMKNDPGFDFMRNDEQFQKIFRRHKQVYDENIRKYGSLIELLN